MVYNVLPNPGPGPRNGTISVGGQSHAIAQAAPAPACTYGVDPPAQTIPAHPDSEYSPRQYDDS